MRSDSSKGLPVSFGKLFESASLISDLGDIPSDVTHIFILTSWRSTVQVLNRVSLTFAGKILVEKPHIYTAEIMEESCKDYGGNVFFAANRRYYRTVETFRKEIQASEVVNVFVTLSEDLRRYINLRGARETWEVLLANCHIMDLLIYIFGSIKLLSISKRRFDGLFYEFSAHLMSSIGAPILLRFNYDAPVPVGITALTSDRKSHSLAPVEVYRRYDGYEKVCRNDEYQRNEYKLNESCTLMEESDVRIGFGRMIDAFVRGDWTRSVSYPERRNLASLISQIDRAG